MRFSIALLIGLVAILPFAIALPKKNKEELSERERVEPTLLQRFELMSQYAAASYCFSNNNSTGTPIICPQHNCPLVESAQATSVYEFQNSRFTDTTGFIAVDQTNHLIVLSFRGSAEWRNYASDVQTTLVPFTLGFNLAAVHLGMKVAWEESETGIVKNLVKAMEEYKGYQVVITGHSLGGGVATLAAVDIRANISAELYTFGAPKVGNQHFVDLVEASSTKNYRITNSGDPVIRLPPRYYNHFQPEYHIFKGRDKAIGLDVGPDDIKIIRSKSMFGAWFKEPIKFKQHTKYFGNITACSSDPDKVAKQAEEVAPKEGDKEEDKEEGDADEKTKRAENAWVPQPLEESLQPSRLSSGSGLIKNATIVLPDPFPQRTTIAVPTNGRRNLETRNPAAKAQTNLADSLLLTAVDYGTEIVTGNKSRRHLLIQLPDPNFPKKKQTLSKNATECVGACGHKRDLNAEFEAMDTAKAQENQAIEEGKSADKADIASEKAKENTRIENGLSALKEDLYTEKEKENYRIATDVRVPKRSPLEQDAKVEKVEGENHIDNGLSALNEDLDTEKVKENDRIETDVGVEKQIGEEQKANDEKVKEKGENEIEEDVAVEKKAGEHGKAEDEREKETAKDERKEKKKMYNDH
ncbi:MAG: hypothetical protein M1812_005272 [Candelaria pacifica]|nr:MAG: hypothetical protein M1812_005272 [Candelaria pacifica]